MAVIADAFVSKLCEILLTSAIEEATKILGVPDEIKKLHRRLKRIQVGLVDAENRRFDNDAINLWLKELRDLMYDAEDIIDECGMEGEKLLSSTSSSSHFVKSPRANAYEEEDINRIGEVFEELRPPPCLEELEIHGYFGHEFPGWMMTPSSTTLLHNLRWLVLKNCALCQQLPPLGMLPQLDVLKIKGASAVTSIGSEFLSLVGGGAGAREWNESKTDSSISPYFPKLEQLFFRNMLNWEEWWWGWEGEDNQTTSLLPSLKKLIIQECPKLRSLPESLLYHATALKLLDIRDAHSLREVQNLPSLTELILIGNSSLVRVSNLPALKHLDVYACEELMYVEGVDAVEHIQLDDREAESLPKWLAGAGEEQSRFPSLHKLTLENKICRRWLPDWPLI